MKLNIRNLHIHYLSWRLPISGPTRLEPCGSDKTLAVAGATRLERRVGKGISAQASHRTVREALTSYGSYYTIKRV